MEVRPKVVWVEKGPSHSAVSEMGFDFGEQ